MPYSRSLSSDPSYLRILVICILANFEVQIELSGLIPQSEEVEMRIGKEGNIRWYDLELLDQGRWLY